MSRGANSKTPIVRGYLTYTGWVGLRSNRFVSVRASTTLLVLGSLQVGGRLGPVHRTAVGEAAGRRNFGTDDHVPVGRSISAVENGRPLLVRNGRETSSVRRG